MQVKEVNKLSSVFICAVATLIILLYVNVYNKGTTYITCKCIKNETLGTYIRQYHVASCEKRDHLGLFVVCILLYAPCMCIPLPLWL